MTEEMKKRIAEADAKYSFGDKMSGGHPQDLPDEAYDLSKWGKQTIHNLPDHLVVDPNGGIRLK